MDGSGKDWRNTGKVLRSLPEDTVACIGFLSRLPVPARFQSSGQIDFRKQAHAFPLAGIIIALPAAALMALAYATSMGSLLASIIAVAALIFTTGALHEDGLADVADGFWGGENIIQRLEIMRDSAIGTYGVLMLIAAFTIRITALAHLITIAGIGLAIFTFVVAASESRGLMLQHWTSLPVARQQVEDDSGKGPSLATRFGVPDDQTLIADYFVMAVVLPLIFLIGILILPIGFGLLIALVLGTVAALLTCLAFTRLSHVKIGGCTGDTLGACQQICEIAFYIGALIAI